MIRSLLTVLALSATMTLGTLGAYAAQLGFDFSNVATAQIQFNGGDNSFTFITGNSDGIDIAITNDNGAFPGSVISYIGNISGTFNFAETGDPADVTGIGTFQLAPDDTLSSVLTGTLEWDELSSLGATIGGLNGQAVINIVWTSFSGADPNLQALYDLGLARVVVTFQLIPTGPPADVVGEDCDGLVGQLRCGGIRTASYSGTLVSAVPEPSTMLLSGFALLGLGGLLRRRSKRS